ncbi:hypothetical protein AGMMS50276_25310 [Synergistales bacterium]|nr:hypothetical protein AGMMS50276_25310 [Synergistales bacterium]
MIRFLFLYAFFFFSLVSASFASAHEPQSLFDAVEQGKIFDVDALSGDVKLRDEKGQTPLFRALQPIAKPGMVKLLLAAGVDTSLKDDSGRDIFEIANAIRDELLKKAKSVELIDDCIRLLLEHNEVMDYRHKLWKFYDICRLGTPEKVSELLRRGALVNVPDKDGLTPLTLALENTDRRVFNILARNGGILSPKRSYEVIGPKETAERDAKEKLLNQRKRDLDDSRQKLRDLEQKRKELINSLDSRDLIISSFIILAVILAAGLGWGLYRRKEDKNKHTPEPTFDGPRSLAEAFQRADIKEAINFIKKGESLMRGESLLLRQLFTPRTEPIQPKELQSLMNAIVEYVDDQNILKTAVDYLIEKQCQQLKDEM